VEGTVVNSVTGAPVPGVKVQLSWSGDTAYSTTSDAQGHFLFDHVQNGVYTAGYSAPDYEWDDFFRGPQGVQPIQMTAGKRIKVEAHMMPMGHLMGRVVDERGAAVPQAQVEVSGSTMQLVLTADPLGRFDIHKFVYAGGYRLSAEPQRGFHAPDPDPETGAPRAWTRTWYPRVTDPESAQEIMVPPGGEVRDIELKILAAPAHVVRGVLLQPDGKPAPKVEVALKGSLTPLTATTRADGAFEFPAVVDGQWYLSAELVSAGVKLRASQPLDVAERTREGIELRLQAPFTVTVKPIAENSQGATPLRPRSVMLSRMEGESRRTEVARGKFEDNGDFIISGAYPGSYEITVLTPVGYYLAAIRQGGAELGSPKLELAPGAPPITVVFRSDGGSVRGSVEDCGSGGVLLVPQDPAQRWPDLIYKERCQPGATISEAGRYDIAAVRPGEYYVVAIAQDRLATFFEPQWNDEMLRHASMVTVRASQAASKDLRALAPSR